MADDVKASPGGCLMECKMGVEVQGERAPRCGLCRSFADREGCYDDLPNISKDIAHKAHALSEEQIRKGFDSLPQTEKIRLWDVEDEQLLEMVKCQALIRVTEIDPKMGTFKVRMKCHWAFRTLNSQEDTEVVLRGVPGIRMPSLMVTVEESRVWKDLSMRKESKSAVGSPASLDKGKVEDEKRTTGKTVYWKGLSTFDIAGFKIYYMQNFPYDRQILNLEQLDFVWRPDKDSDDYYKSMRVVHFTVKECTSMLPEWCCWAPLIQEVDAVPVARKETPPDAVTAGSKDTITYAFRFKVHLRIERRHWFYVRQVFITTYLILLVSCTPLLMPTNDGLGDRMVMYGGGLLTLVAFKYGIADHLPSVPYSTFTDDFLMWQLLTIFLCTFETLISYRCIQFWVADDLGDSVDSVLKTWDQVENTFFILLFLVWSAWTFHAAFVKPHLRTPWREVSLRAEQDNPDRMQ